MQRESSTNADDRRLRAFRQAFADRVELPATASVLDEPVTVVEIVYGGNPRHGLTARCRTSLGREHVIALADVRFQADLRCLDAHAHLGNLVFDHAPGEAIRHYELGVRIGQLSLGEAFNGVLRWGLIDNRPFLRCMNGYGLCLWRLGRWDDAARAFDRILWMNPADHQGIRLVLPEVLDGRPWEESSS